MRNVNYKPKEILEIEWNDTATHSGWRSQKALEKAKPVPCRTIGYFCRQNKNTITVAKCLDDDDADALDAQTIPKVVIGKVRRLSK